MNNISKKHPVVMLPTEKSRLYIYPPDSELYLNFCKEDVDINRKGGEIGKPQHLYILSDEEIKEGDWCLDLSTKSVERAVLYYLKSYSEDDKIKKIIATTNSELKVLCKGKLKYLPTNGREYMFPYTCNKCSTKYLHERNGTRYYTDKACDNEYNIAQIPTDFIQAYVKAYNEGKPIEWVMLEYYRKCCKDGVHFAYCVEECENSDTLYLKLRDDNTVIIHRVKERKYSRQELLNASLSYFDDFMHDWKKNGAIDPIKSLEWFNKNYPE
jgi:hypothetical protein